MTLQLGRQCNRSIHVKNTCKAVCQSDGQKKQLQQHTAVVCVDCILRSRKFHGEWINGSLFH